MAPAAKKTQKISKELSEISDEDINLDDLGDLDDDALDLGDLEGEVTLDDVEKALGRIETGDSGDASLVLNELGRVGSELNSNVQTLIDSVASLAKGHGDLAAEVAKGFGKLYQMIGVLEQRIAEIGAREGGVETDAPVPAKKTRVKVTSTPKEEENAHPGLTHDQQATLLKLAGSNKKAYPVQAFAKAVTTRVPVDVQVVIDFYTKVGLVKDGKMTSA